MRIKICGITSSGDGLQAAYAGADAIGLVFYQPSTRYVTVKQAATIARAIGPFVTTVGLFVNESKEIINRVLSQVPLQVIQFHGDESAAFCEQFFRPYVKAIRMQDGINIKQAIAEHPNAIGILLDAYEPNIPGGTGNTFDWHRVPRDLSKPIILAGGLTPANVCDAIAQVGPYGVDVSGGVEINPGEKSAEKVTAFINNVSRLRECIHE